MCVNIIVSVSISVSKTSIFCPLGKYPAKSENRKLQTFLSKISNVNYQLLLITTVPILYANNLHIKTCFCCSGGRGLVLREGGLLLFFVCLFLAFLSSVIFLHSFTSVDLLMYRIETRNNWDATNKIFCSCLVHLVH